MDRIRAIGARLEWSGDGGATWARITRAEAWRRWDHGDPIWTLGIERPKGPTRGRSSAATRRARGLVQLAGWFPAPVAETVERLSKRWECSKQAAIVRAIVEAGAANDRSGSQ